MATIDIVIEFPDGTTDVMVYNNGKDVKSVVISIRESCLLTGGILQKANRKKLKYTRITNAAEVLDASMIYKFSAGKRIGNLSRKGEGLHHSPYSILSLQYFIYLQVTNYVDVLLVLQ